MSPARGCGAYCSCAYPREYCSCSCAAQRPACRRETRLDTEVAVPAITAVLATPRIRPGIVILLPSPAAPSHFLDLATPVLVAVSDGGVSTVIIRVARLRPTPTGSS